MDRGWMGGGGWGGLSRVYLEMSGGEPCLHPRGIYHVEKLVQAPPVEAPSVYAPPVQCPPVRAPSPCTAAPCAPLRHRMGGGSRPTGPPRRAPEPSERVLRERRVPLPEKKKRKKENYFLTYGGNGVRRMGKRGCVGEKKGTPPWRAPQPPERLLATVELGEGERAVVAVAIDRHAAWGEGGGRGGVEGGGEGGGWEVGCGKWEIGRRK